MIKKLLFPLLFLGGPWAAYAQPEDIPDSIRLMTQTGDSSLSWLMENRMDTAVFQQVAWQALAGAYRSEDNRLIADLHAELARWHGYHVLFSRDSIAAHREKALEYYLKTKDKAKIAESYNDLSIDYANANDYANAQEALFKAIALYEEIGDRQGIGKAYKNLSSISRVQEQPQLAIKYGIQAIDILQELEDYYNISITLLNLIDAHTQLQEYERAFQYADECIAMVQAKVPEEKFILSRAFSFRGSIYVANRDYAQALEDHTTAWKIVERELGPERAATYRTDVGNVLRLQGDYQEAIPHLRAGIAALEALGVEQIWEPYEQLADCYEQSGNPVKALQYFKRAAEVRRVMVEDKIANLESEAVIKYETGKKDQALAEQARQIRQKTRTQLLSAGVAALLLVLLAFLFRSYRKNRKITAALQARNAENELLLKEIHHRVKNNLQTISSLLSLQSESIQDPSAWDAVQESKNRVNSMALLHQKLYQGENLAAIEMRDYFETIGKTILDSFGEKAEHLSLQVEMPELELDVDTAVPIGLITNELVTNSIKHAFPGREKGKISIALSTDENDMLQLHISDNGQANANEGVSKDGGGFGTLLVQLLTAQLGGQLEKSTEEGTAITIRFPRQEKSAA